MHTTSPREIRAKRHFIVLCAQSPITKEIFVNMCRCFAVSRYFHVGTCHFIMIKRVQHHASVHRGAQNPHALKYTSSRTLICERSLLLWLRSGLIMSILIPSEKCSPYQITLHRRNRCPAHPSTYSFYKSVTSARLGCLDWQRL